MTHPELPALYDQLNPHLAMELIAPHDQWHPLGKGDALSHYIYEPMREAQSADRMIELIGFTETTIDKTETENEYNQLKISRLAALVADTPEELPLEEKGRAWRHLISADWVHLYGDTLDTNRVIEEVTGTDGELAGEVAQIKATVLQEKLAAVRKVVEDNVRLPGFTDQSVSFDRAMAAYNRIRAAHPSAFLPYNTVIVLAMSDHRFTHSS